MITIETVLKIHDLVIEQFGGSKGIRDMAALESAINRPFATFGQTELYPNPIDKAGAIFESILKNHPFIDGNKRTGYILMRLILLQHKLEISTTFAKKHDFAIAVAEGKINQEAIKTWLELNVKKINK